MALDFLEKMFSLIAIYIILGITMVGKFRLRFICKQDHFNLVYNLAQSVVRLKHWYNLYKMSNMYNLYEQSSMKSNVQSNA
jgi:hypothetical protein